MSSEDHATKHKGLTTFGWIFTILLGAYLCIVGSGLIYAIVRVAGPFLDAIDRGELWANAIVFGGALGVIVLWVKGR